MIAGEVAAKIGVKAALAERHRVGGDCLWTGCVPSKALLASAKAAHTMRHADHYGLPSVEPEIDTSLVWKRIRAIQQDIAMTDDNPERFQSEGVEIITGTARNTPALVAVLTRKLTDEGVDLRPNVNTDRVTMSDGRKIVHGTENGEPSRWEAEELLVAVGRRPNVEGLGLEEVGVKVGKRGIE